MFAIAGARTLLRELRKLLTDFNTSGNTFFLCSKGALCQLKGEGREGLDRAPSAETSQ